jgi:hypothetical protein
MPKNIFKNPKNMDYEIFQKYSYNNNIYTFRCPQEVVNAPIWVVARYVHLTLDRGWLINAKRSYPVLPNSKV